MPNIAEISEFDEGVYLIDESDFAAGGVNGAANKAAIALANRTRFLKDRIDAMGGMQSKSVAGGVNVTLAATEAERGIIRLTGVLTANISVIVPETPRRLYIINATTGNFAVTVRTLSGSGVVVAQGKTRTLICDGADVLWANTDFNLAGGVLTAPVLKGYRESVVTQAIAANHTIDCSAANVHVLTLQASLALSFGSVPADAYSVTLWLIQDGAGNRVPTFPASVTWPRQGAAPVWSKDAGRIDVVSFGTVNGGASWLGFPAGEGY